MVCGHVAVAEAEAHSRRHGVIGIERDGRDDGVAAAVDARESREVGDAPVLDVQPGYADGLSLDAGDGLHFVTRYEPAGSTPVTPDQE